MVVLPQAELAELWSFVLKKTNTAWLWMALCRKRRQVVAYAVGDCSQQTCPRFWEAIPPAYCAGHGSTDFWTASQAVLRSMSSTAPKDAETGATAHTERWKNTLRQRLARARLPEALVLHIAAHAPCVSLALSPSLQPGTGYHAHVTHYRLLNQKPQVDFSGLNMLERQGCFNSLPPHDLNQSMMTAVIWSCNEEQFL
jgi:IS1 family transposase